VAAWELRWNNPRLHEPARRKTWMACGRHRESLSDFLAIRGFLRESVALTASVDDVERSPATTDRGTIDSTATGRHG